MTFETLISVEDVELHLGDQDWAIIDCRYDLNNPEKGRQEYLKAHIPGAIYAHLDEDLSSDVIPGKTGRHPLPSIMRVSEVFSNYGIGPDVQVVAYDNAGGALAAVRIWWMLRWLNHNAVAVLDGGWQKWLEAGYPVSNGQEVRPNRHFIPNPRPELIIDAQQIETMRQNPNYLVVDARASERYHGENETIDPIAGHIPGAISVPYLINLNEEGVFRSPEELGAIYQEIIGDIPLENIAFYCGSGVTSIHNILAAMHAGLGEGRLYVGSWSEWITDPRRPIST